MAATVTILTMSVVPGLARAATPSHSSKIPFKLGGYTGRVSQHPPRLHNGRLAFTVHRQSVTALSFTVGVVCNGMRAIDADVIPRFTTKISHSGAFSYAGTIHGRKIRLSGRIRAGRATGTFFQSFVSRALHCSMSKPAPFTASR